MNICYIKKKSQKTSVFLMLAAMLFSAENLSAATLNACAAAKTICTSTVGSWVSSCMGRASNNIGGATQSSCLAQANSYQSYCNTSATQCTETYIYPQPKLVSILYLPPGDKSSIGYSSTNSAGTTESYTTSTSSTNSLGLSVKILGQTGGESLTVENSTSYSTTITTNLVNTASTTWLTSGNPIDHTKDLLTIWLNPQITEANFNTPGAPASLTTNYGKPVFGIYTTMGNAGYNPTANSNGSPIFDSAISNGNTSLITIPVSALLNPTKLLPSQLVSRTNADGTIVAGLLSMCKNRIPEAQCTVAAAQANGCGCTAADFSPIVQLHPFFDPNVSSPSVASINAIDPNGARFVPVKDSSGYDLALPLQAGVTKSLSISDSYNSAYTYTNSTKKTTSSKFGFSYSGNTGGGIDGSVSWSYTNSVGKGGSTGTAHAQSLTLATSSASCYQYVNVYEDTLFHTFLFTNASNALNPCP